MRAKITCRGRVIHVQIPKSRHQMTWGLQVDVSKRPPGLVGGLYAAIKHKSNKDHINLNGLNPLLEQVLNEASAEAMATA